MCLPKDVRKNETKNDEEEDSDASNEDVYNNQSKKWNEIETNSYRNDNEDEDKISKHEKNNKEREQCQFDMIENTAHNTKKLENIVIENYSDLEKSDKLSERQRKRVYSLKQKRHKSIKKGMSDETLELKKRGSEIKGIGKGDKIIKVKIFDTELCHSWATK